MRLQDALQALALAAAGAALFTALPHPARGATADGAVLHPRFQAALQAPGHVALLQQGEDALRRGDAATAQQAFEQALGLVHAAEGELGLVRATLLAGRWREALAFCAHTAGVHAAESATPTALYGALLGFAGQRGFAQQLLARTRPAAPGSPLLADAQALLAAGFGVPAAELLQGAHRLAPYPVVPHGLPAPGDGARVLGGAVLLPGGHQALVPARLAQASARLWVRDTQGRTVPARPLQDPAPPGAVRLALDVPLADPEGDGFGPAPMPGRPAVALAWAPQADAAPSWPWLFDGFAGRHPRDGGAQALDIALPDAADGLLVLDAQGRAAGLGLRGPDGRLRLQPLSGPQAGTGPDPAPPVPVDEAYERGLRFTLQLIGTP